MNREMAPASYDRLRHMSLVRATLRRADPALERMPAIARINGFTDLGHFAGRYRALFGEALSTTLRYRSKVRPWCLHYEACRDPDAHSARRKPHRIVAARPQVAVIFLPKVNSLAASLWRCSVVVNRTMSAYAELLQSGVRACWKYATRSRKRNS